MVFLKFYYNGTMTWGIFDLTIGMEKYILGEILSSGGATLYKNPSDQTVPDQVLPPINLFFTSSI